MNETPSEKIKKTLSKKMPKDLLEYLPGKWEKTGDVLTLAIPKKLVEYKEEISEIYAKILGCKTVLNDIGGISGEYRKPNVEVLFGSKNTETIHKENKIIYKLDPQKIMFSSGNMDERIRMANISNPQEVVVDFFAGIGYFTLPIAVYSMPKKVFAVEKNPISYGYLCQNIVLNNVTSIVEPLKGDNREVAPRNVADRVILGYFGDTHKFLPFAFNCLKNQEGVIHYHDKFVDESIPDMPMNIIEKVAGEYDRGVNLIRYKKVKSYAPGISHYVFDVEIGEK